METNRASYDDLVFVEYAANTKRVLCFVFRAIRNFIIEWAEAFGSMAVRRSAHIANRKSENFGQRMFWLYLICHAVETLLCEFVFFEKNPVRWGPKPERCSWIWERGRLDRRFRRLAKNLPGVQLLTIW